MKLTKNFRIKTQEGFTDVINFLSESVYFKDGRNLDTRIQNEVDTLNNRVDTEVNTLNNKINSEVDILKKADAAEKTKREEEIDRVEGLIADEQTARTNADTALTDNLNQEKTAREQDVNAINEKIGSVAYTGNSLTAAIKTNQESINTINTITIPGLQQSINTINDTTVPSVKKEISDLAGGQVKTNTDNISTLQNQNLDTRLKALEEDTSVVDLIALIGGGSLEEGMETILARLVVLEEKVAALENPPEEEPSEPEQTE